MDDPHFKQCPSCQEWFSRKAVLRGPLIRPIGMLVDSDNVALSMMYFQHNREGCGTSFTVPVLEFLPELDEAPEFHLSRFGCPRHCLKLEDLAECKENCFYAPFRRLILAAAERRSEAMKAG